jgi:hypothetical protein
MSMNIPPREEEGCFACLFLKGDNCIVDDYFCICIYVAR